MFAQIAKSQSLLKSGLSVHAEFPVLYRQKHSLNPFLNQVFPYYRRLINNSGWLLYRLNPFLNQVFPYGG